MKAAPFRALLFLSVLCSALYSCSRSHPNARQFAEPNPQEFTGPTVDVPEFTIAVKLSADAEKRLRNMHESVKVIAYFDGDPLPGQGKYNPPMRDVYLGMDEKLVDEKNVATFNHTRVPLADWNRLADKNYYVTINTVSARKVASNNLLDCADPIDRRIATLRGRTTEVPCWLIGEPNSPNRWIGDKSL